MTLIVRLAGAELAGLLFFFIMPELSVTSTALRDPRRCRWRVAFSSRYSSCGCTPRRGLRTKEVSFGYRQCQNSMLPLLLFFMLVNSRVPLLAHWR